MQGKIVLRPEVEKFAQLMESKLRKKDYKGGWQNRPTATLWHAMHAEVVEFDEAIVEQLGIVHITEEAVDVANYLMMIADKLGGLNWKEVPDGTM